MVFMLSSIKQTVNTEGPTLPHRPAVEKPDMPTILTFFYMISKKKMVSGLG